MSLTSNTTEIYVVTESSKLEDTIGAAASNITQTKMFVIALGPNIYPQQKTYKIKDDVVIINDPKEGSPTRETTRMQRQLLARGLQSSLENSVIVAPPNARHFTFENATLLTDGVTFVGDTSAASSGGVELEGPSALGFFNNTVFLDCRITGYGGGLLLTSGAAANLMMYVIFVHVSL